MQRRHTAFVAAPLAVVGLALGGCGTSSSTSVGSAPPPSSVAAAPAGSATAQAAGAAAVSIGPQSGPATSGPGALTVSEAQAAASGDVPDNQVFLVYQDPAAGFSMKYPEGWARRAIPGGVIFRDHNNLVRVTTAAGASPTLAAVTADLARLRTSDPSVVAGKPSSITLSGQPVLKVTYTTESAPNAVTGKRVTLGVDRYYLAGGGKVAVVDLGTPRGVDNVDAYRLMIESFRWK